MHHLNSQFACLSIDLLLSFFIATQSCSCESLRNTYSFWLVSSKRIRTFHSPKMDSISLNSQRKNISRKPITRLADDESIWNWIIFFPSFSENGTFFRVFFIALFHLTDFFSSCNWIIFQSTIRGLRKNSLMIPAPTLTDWYMMCIITYFCNYYAVPSSIWDVKLLQWKKFFFPLQHTYEYMHLIYCESHKQKHKQKQLHFMRRLFMILFI